MEVEDLFSALAHWIMLSDKHNAYLRPKTQPFWQRQMLITGDLGGNSTKLLWFDCHEADFNSGQKGHILFYCEKAPDTYQNMKKWMVPRLAPSLEVLQQCCVVRLKCVVKAPPITEDELRHKSLQHNVMDKLAAATLVLCPVRRFLPTMFMLKDKGPQSSDFLTDHEPSNIDIQRFSRAVGNKVPEGQNLYNIILLSGNPQDPMNVLHRISLDHLHWRL
jgi:hypothetical protein